MSYWESRKHLAYYAQAVAWAKAHTPAGGSILDVGGGVTMGCEYLSWLPGYDRTSVETRHGNAELPGVRLIISRFEDWTPDRHYDTVLCLQCVEHLTDPAPFIAKMRSIGYRLILSVPYMWAHGLEDCHIHDPIDRSKVKSWVGSKPLHDCVLGVKPWERLVSLYIW